MRRPGGGEPGLAAIDTKLGEDVEEARDEERAIGHVLNGRATERWQGRAFADNGARGEISAMQIQRQHLRLINLAQAR